MLKKLLCLVTLLLVLTTLAYAGTGQGKRGSCKYCHNGIAPVVGTGLSCGGCHVNPPATGAHRAHTDGSGAIYGSDANDSVLTYRFNCGNCHPTDIAKHGNSITDLELYNPAATGFKSKNPASAGLTGTVSATVCSNIYCHSAGLPAVVNSYAPSPLWGGGFSGNRCAGCHSFPPNYNNNAPKANSHVPHNFSCNTCHAGTTADGATIYNASVHVNGSFDVTPGSGTAFTYAYAPTGGTCSSISCHGNTNATWGGTVVCGACHGNPPPNAATGYTGVAEATSPHMKHAGKGNNYSYACGECHKGNRHGTGTFQDVFIDKNGIIAGPAATYITGTRTCSAVNCHSAGTSIATGQPAGGSVIWGSAKLGCNGCHANPPAYANNSPKANSHFSPSHRVSCGSCHAGTTTDGTTITNLTRHVNGAYDLQPGTGVSFTYSFATSGGTCSNISCHGALSATWGGTATCLVCHSVVQGNRAAITSQFGANSHHIQGVITDAQCYQCHWEANNDGSINPTYHSGSSAPGAPVDLVVYGVGARPASYNTVNSATAIQYTANGTRAEIQKLNYHCLGCHSDQNNTTQPFGDGKTPKQYAWDGSSVAARYSQSGTTPWGKYDGGNVSQKTAQTKAFSAHGNATQNKGGWDTNETWPDTRTSTTNVTCYDCHNSHGSGVSGTTTSYASATANAGILKDTVAGTGGYSQTYKPSSGGSSATKNAFTAGAGLCFDCHQNATTGTKPWGYSDTFGATQKIIGYWDTDFFGPGTFGSQTRFPYKAKTGNQGGHFGASAALSASSSHAIGGLCTPCHDPHGVSPSLGADKQYAVPLLKGTWVTSPYREDTAPANNDAGTAIFDGVPYHIDQNTFASGGVTQTDAQFAGLCLSCHSKPSLTNGSNHTWKSKDRIHEAVKGWKTANGTIQHNFTCSKCHAPHNSRLPKLMVTNCLNSMHKGRTGYNPSAVLSGGGSGDWSGCYGSSINACGDFGYWDLGSGSGGGNFPGNYSGSAVGTNSISCHEGNNPDESWNNVTPWNNLTAPASPIGISATAGNMLAIISWTAGTGDYVSSLIRYGTTTGNYTTTIDPATSPRVITGLANGTNIYYQVGAKNAAGTVWSGQFSVTPVLTLPSAPTGISATAGNAQTAISWSAGLGSTTSLIRYGTTIGNYTTTIDPATSPKVVTSLTNGTTIYYQVGARNAAGTVWSAEYSVTPVLPLPSAPTGISAIAGNAQATVSWTAGANSTSSLIRYGAVYGTYTTTFDPATSPRVFTGLVNGTYYYYQVGAKNAAGITWSGVYSVRPVLPPLSAPTVISAIAGNAQATVSWTAGANSTSSLIRYGTVSGSYTTTFDPASSPRVLTGLVNGTTYYYQVGAKNAAGTIAWSGQYSVTPVGPPSAPTGISATSANTQATISWTAGPSATSSQIRYGTTSGVYTTIIDPATSPRVITGLVNGTTIYYQVGTTNASGTTWSTQGSVTPTAFSPFPTPAPDLTNYYYGGTYYYTFPYNSDCSNPAPATLSWYPVTAPDGDPVEYNVQLNGVPQGWQSVTSFTYLAGPAGSDTWTVKARDVVHTGVESPYYSSATLYIWDGTNCSPPSSSCPLVYSSNGTKFNYETDLQGPAISQVWKPGRYVNLYQPSYIVLNGLAPDATNQYRVKIWESLNEATLLDEAKLLAVDYPEGHQIVSSGAENTYYYGYVNPFTIYTIKDSVLPISATDKNGIDILASVLSVDNNPTPMAPADPDNFYTFDFGTIQHPENAKLVIDGWQDINSKIYLSTLTIQPYIEVVDANGAWVKVKTFGMPMGDLKTMVIDIANKFQSADQRIRLHLGIKKAQVWVIDRIRLDESAPVSVTVQELPASYADLQKASGDAIQLMTSLQHRIITSDEPLPFKTGYEGYGNFTRYGEVGELLTQRDDKYVMLNYGDKLEMTFPAPSVPQPGMTRGFILKADNYYKDFKTYRYLEPLPFHGMSDYPPPAPEAYPTDADHQQYLLDYNTRILPGPANPTLTPQPSPVYASGDTAGITFQWNGVTAPDGDSVVYLVEVSSAANMATISYQSSWQTGTSWAQTLPAGTWYWRVKARDSIHTTMMFTSTTGSIVVVDTTPAAPILTDQSDFYSSGDNVGTTLQWSETTCADGDSPEYYVEVDTTAAFNSGNIQNSGWISGTSWTVPLGLVPAGVTTTWYWRVTARDGIHQSAVSIPTSSHSFQVIYAAP